MENDKKNEQWILKIVEEKPVNEVEWNLEIHLFGYKSILKHNLSASSLAICSWLSKFNISPPALQGGNY